MFAGATPFHPYMAAGFGTGDAADAVWTSDPPEQVATPAIPARIAGLDVWRALLMLGGLVRHSAEAHQGTPLFAGLVLASVSFRMGAFFGISGLLMGCALRRRPAREWRRARLRRLGVPLAFGLLVLCPLTSLLRGWEAVAAGQAFTFALSWHHLWFLVALFAYTWAAFMLERHGGVARLLPTRPVAPVRAGKAIFMTGAIGFIIVLLCATAMERFISPGHRDAWTQLPWMISYAPLFALGLLIARSDRPFDGWCMGGSTPAAVLLLVAVLYGVWFGGVGSGAAAVRWEPHVIAFGTSFAPPAAFLLILRSAAKIRTVPVALRRLSDASFTMYLLHFPILAAARVGLARVDWNDYAEFGIALLAATLLSYVAHVRLVRRSGLLSLLLNGHRPAPAHATALPLVTTLQAVRA